MDNKEMIHCQSGVYCHGNPIKLPTGIDIIIDPDVALVIEFMILNLEATKIIKVANAVNELAIPLFRRYVEEPNFHTKKFIPLAVKTQQR